MLLVFADEIGRGEDRTLRRTVAVVHLVVRRRVECREGFAAHGEVEERMTVHVRRELIADLRRHEGVRDAFGIEITTEFGQVETQIFGHDIDGCTARQRRIEVHHAGIEAEGGVRRYLMADMQVVVAPVPVTERDEVTVLELDTLGHAGGAARIKQDEEVGGIDLS